MIVNSMLIRRGLPVTLVMAAAILMQPASASAGGGYFSLSVGLHYPFHGHHHGHHLRVPGLWFRGFHAWPYHHYPVVGAPIVAPASWRGGALSLRVKPKRTEVYVDGAYVGTAGKYDGYPGYLWLDAGVHTLTFYKEGYRPFERVFEVRPGLITDVRLEMVRLEAGQGQPPPPSVAPPPPATGSPPPSGSVLEPLGPTTESPSGARRGEPILDLRGEGGTVRLRIEPAEASIYLDGRFLGTGTEMERLHGGLLVDVGAHAVEVVHPRYLSERINFRMAAGEDLELRIDLDPVSESG